MKNSDAKLPSQEFLDVRISYGGSSPTVREFLRSTVQHMFDNSFDNGPHPLTFKGLQTMIRLQQSYYDLCILSAPKEDRSARGLDNPPYLLPVERHAESFVSDFRKCLMEIRTHPEYVDNEAPRFFRATPHTLERRKLLSNALNQVIEALERIYKLAPQQSPTGATKYINTEGEGRRI